MALITLTPSVFAANHSNKYYDSYIPDRFELIYENETESHIYESYYVNSDFASITLSGWKVNGLKPYIKKDLSSFKDAKKVSDYAVSQMKWAVGAGVITGNADGTLNPLGTATRAEVAVMLEKYCKKVGR